MTEFNWKDISAEKFRRYTLKSGVKVYVENPRRLHIAESGSHRVETLDGYCYWIARDDIAAIEFQSEKGFEF